MYQEERKGIKRGVSIYSYSGEFSVSMDLEDCFADMHSMGANGLEILANGHIPDYPYPNDEWIENTWKGLLQKYEIVPVEYGHWIDSRLFEGRELTTEESYNLLVRDIKIAHKLGFTVMRTKLGVIDDTNTPVKNWKEFIKMALPVAEENNVRMCPEIHMPTALKSKMVDEYVNFIEQNNTKYFGINVDFGTFQDKFQSSFRLPGMPKEGPCSRPEDIIPLLKYVYCCHAKFNYMNDDFEETTIPYEKIINEMRNKQWDGYLLSEYEGPHKDEIGFVSEQLRRQHIMMKRILGY